VFVGFILKLYTENMLRNWSLSAQHTIKLHTLHGILTSLNEKVKVSGYMYVVWRIFFWNGNRKRAGLSQC